jgi:hypothetical protein
MKDEPVIIEENMPGGAYRKAIYQCIQETIKRPLTENEHTYLSRILKLYVDAHVSRVTKSDATIVKNEQKRS